MKIFCSSICRAKEIFKPLAFLAILSVGLHSSNALAQTVDTKQIICYRESIKNPYSFMGFSGDTFQLSDGSSWKVSGGQYQTISPYNGGAVVVCPDWGKLIIGSVAISIQKASKGSW